ncbi:hypothetical protein KCP76_00205 [Salmonella enterica subsp. enterica serovar Weltevreden]|nr:hypothetical protein KCP76_00205 [Salmonella enterica subsp. enterica serovar Weltevreden]
MTPVSVDDAALDVAGKEVQASGGMPVCLPTCRIRRFIAKSNPADPPIMTLAVTSPQCR